MNRALPAAVAQRPLLVRWEAGNQSSVFPFFNFFFSLFFCLFLFPFFPPPPLLLFILFLFFFFKETEGISICYRARSYFDLC